MAFDPYLEKLLKQNKWKFLNPPFLKDEQ